MESFIYREINKASREKDTTKITSFGPIAAALSFIVQHANQNRKDKIKGNFTLYRGARMTLEELEGF